MKRNSCLPLTMATALSMVAGCAAAENPLLFPKDDYTEETRTVRTSSGEKAVTVHSYQHLLYVAKPVDSDYHSLNVTVPVEIDGKAVDATGAPILLVVGVGGYMSSSNAGGRPGRGGMRRGPGGPRGGGMGSPAGDSRNVSGNRDLALAAGFVVVSPGVRGRDNQAGDGTYFGKAPAAIVDLKAAVRYIRHNAGVMPGNPDWIVATGVSAGGALSALLGASGNSALYELYLEEIGAAGERDDIYASAPFCPIADLEHADMAYEWMFGATPARTGLVDQELSQQLKDAFDAYQDSLGLTGGNGFGAITANNYAGYLLQKYLIPSANKYLSELANEERDEYLANNRWITWTDNGSAFTFADYLTHIGRMKGLPAFDDFGLTQPEPNLFGNATTDSRHFTIFSLRHSTGDLNAQIDDDIPMLLNMMNPMYFIGQDNSGMSRYWWIRHGSADAHTSLTVITNLAISLENRNKEVDARLYWDAGHGADQDPEEFISWIGKITGLDALH